jgi:hypothetical protein
MSKYYFLFSLIFLLSSCKSTPQVDDGLQIRIMEEGLKIEIYDIRDIQNNSSSMQGGTITAKKKLNEKNMMIKQVSIAKNTLKK